MSGVRLGSLAALLAALLLSAQPAAGKTLAKRGRIYDAKGVHLNQYEDLALDFKTSSNGKRITHFFTTFLTVSCGGNTVFQPNYNDNLATSIGSQGTFTFQIQTRDPNNGQPSGAFVVLGRFKANHLASGTATFHGTGTAAGCNMSRGWKSKLRPLFDRFAGTTSKGTRASFYRTIEAHPAVTNFNFGPIKGKCSDGRKEPKTTTSVYSARIRQNRFSLRNAFTTDGEALSLSGTFASSTQASGKVSLTGRDDCSFAGVRWSVRRVARRVTGPLNFPTLSP